MPRNPNKRHCQTPSCHNWAMRDHSHCRVHRNAELGRSRAGAPKANFNAVKTGSYAQPLTHDQLRDLAVRLAHDPNSFDSQLLPVIIDIHQRADRHPLKSIVLLRQLLDQLFDPVATAIFNLMLEDYLDKLPEAERPDFQAYIWKHAVHFTPLNRIVLLQKIIDKFPSDKSSAQPTSDPPEKSTEKQSTGSSLECTIPFDMSLSRVMNVRPPPQR